jgi:hypothetical protein
MRECVGAPLPFWPPGRGPETGPRTPRVRAGGGAEASGRAGPMFPLAGNSGSGGMGMPISPPGSPPKDLRPPKGPLSIGPLAGFIMP